MPFKYAEGLKLTWSGTTSKECLCSAIKPSWSDHSQPVIDELPAGINIIGEESPHRKTAKDEAALFHQYLILNPSVFSRFRTGSAFSSLSAQRGFYMPTKITTGSKTDVCKACLDLVWVCVTRADVLLYQEHLYELLTWMMKSRGAITLSIAAYCSETGVASSTDSKARSSCVHPSSLLKPRRKYKMSVDPDCQWLWWVEIDHSAPLLMQSLRHDPAAIFDARRFVNSEQITPSEPGGACLSTLKGRVMSPRQVTDRRHQGKTRQGGSVEGEELQWKRVERGEGEEAGAFYPASPGRCSISQSEG